MTANVSGESRYILVIEYDLSLTTGYSINERESAVALLDQFPDRIQVVSPRPAFPESFHDPRIAVVRDHRRHHPLHYPRFLASLRRKLRQMVREQPTAAVIFRPGPFPLVPALTLRDGTPIILKKLSGYSMFARQDRARFKSLVAASARPLYRYITRGCLGADIESHAYAEWLPEAFSIPRSKLTIVPNGANTQVFCPLDRAAARKAYGWERFDHIIGYVGAIDELRCIEAAVDAARLLRDVPGLALVVVGGGPQAEHIRRRVAVEGLEDRVILPGFLPYPEIPTIMNAFDLALDLTRVPLVVGDQTVFGSYSQKIAQYLACGVPVVAWDTPDTSFLDREGVGRTVPIENVGELAATLRTLVTDADARGEMSRRSRAHACSALSAESIAKVRMEFWDRMTRREDVTAPR